jgi:diacylglycerol kinase family enzyme
VVGKAFDAVGIDADVRCVAGDALRGEARAALKGDADVIVAAGGDGTISSVAAALAGGDKPLGVLPMGTLNHFAKDLRIPADVAEAARVIADGHIQCVDLGRVNGQVFINNSSLGVYARALVNRDATRSQWGLSKWQAMAIAALRTFWRAPMVHVRLDVDGEADELKTPLVFVGNNRYRLDRLRIGGRDRLDEGVLSVYVARTSSRWGMLKLAIRGVMGQLEQARDFQTMFAREVTIVTRHKKKLHVAADGELRRMESPLRYASWPGALRVFAPEKRLEAPASGRG